MKTNKIKLLTITAITGLTALVGLGALVHNHIKEAKADTITDLTDTTWRINTSTSTARQAEYQLNGTIFVNDVEYGLNIYDSDNIHLGYYFDDEMWEGEANQVLITTSDSGDNWLIEINATNLLSNTYLLNITGGQDVSNSDLITWLQVNATLQSGGSSEPEEPTPEEPTPDTPSDSESESTYYTFTFNYQINYYAPYDMNITSYFVQDSELTTSNMFKAITILEGIEFTSGGQTFNKIVARYFNAISSYYLDDNGNRQVWGADNFASYQQLEYVNTTTNHVEIVNKRLYQPFNTSTASGYVPMLASQWIAPQYQVIRFAEPVNEITITQLSKFNNATSLNGNTYTAYNEAGVTGAFELMSLAFTSWLPILSIQVLPNISLGLLILLPLMVGIVILIIWVVKR